MSRSGLMHSPFVEGKDMLKEVLVVEGKMDVVAVRKALDADCIVTGGFSLGRRALRAKSLRAEISSSRGFRAARMRVGGARSSASSSASAGRTRVHSASASTATA